MPKLIIHLPDGGIAKHTLEAAAYTLGRTPGNDIVLPEGAASGHHAVLKLSDSGDYTVTDLGSTNHTRVNGRVIQIQQLRNADRVHFGDTVAEYESEIVGPPPFEDQPTQIYERGAAHATASVPSGVAAAAAGQTAVRIPAPSPGPGQTVFRPVPAAPRRRAKKGGGEGDGGCFALLMVLFLPLAFVIGMVVRHREISGGQWLWDYVREVLSAS